MQRQFPSWKRDRRHRRGRVPLAGSHGDLAIARDADQRTRRRDHHPQAWHGVCVADDLCVSHSVADADGNRHADGRAQP